MEIHNLKTDTFTQSLFLAKKIGHFLDLSQSDYLLFLPWKARFFIPRGSLCGSLLFICRNIKFGRFSFKVMASILSVVLAKCGKLSDSSLDAPIIYISSDDNTKVNLIMHPNKLFLEKYIEFGSGDLAESYMHHRKLIDTSIFQHYFPKSLELKQVGNTVYLKEEFVSFRKIWFNTTLVPYFFGYFVRYLNDIAEKMKSKEYYFLVHGDLTYWNTAITVCGGFVIFDLDKCHMSDDYLKDFVRFISTLPITLGHKKVLVSEFYDQYCDAELRDIFQLERVLQEISTKS